MCPEGKSSMLRNQSQMKLQKILAPVDFSGSMPGTLQHAAAFAREYGAAITLLHVVKPDQSCLTHGIARLRLAEEVREAGECQLSQLIDVLWADEIKAEAIVAIGIPHLQIVNEAREIQADLIIMGTHGPVGIWGLFRRNTTSKVVRYAPCPVLVVPLFERGFPVGSPMLRSIDT
jgi:nucleotide-binding universal stress UspA family protein